MKNSDIMIDDNDTYFVVTAASYYDPLIRYIVGATEYKRMALVVCERQVSGMVFGFPTRQAAYETYPELQPPSERALAIAAMYDEWRDAMQARALERCREPEEDEVLNA